MLHEADTPTTRILFKDLNLDEATKHLEDIREKRLKLYRVYKEALMQKQAGKLEKISATQAKNIDMLGKEFDKLDATMEKIEGRIHKIYTMMVEIGTLELALQGL